MKIIKKVCWPCNIPNAAPGFLIWNRLKKPAITSICAYTSSFLITNHFVNWSRIKDKAATNNKGEAFLSLFRIFIFVHVKPMSKKNAVSNQSGVVIC